MQEALDKALTQLDTLKDEDPILHRNAMDTLKDIPITDRPV